MNVQWYFSHDGDKAGPYSGRQLMELAATGAILPTDTIWKEGIEQGMPAQNVRNLFTPAQADTSPASTGAVPGNRPVTSSEPAPSCPPSGPSQVDSPRAEAPDTLVTVPDQTSPPNALTVQKKAGLQNKPPSKARAVAVRGAVITNQDGITVQFRKKCSKCGFEDPCKSRLPIRNGTTRDGYFCPKCRKMQPVEIQGTK
jgi:hypothetical protein